MCGCLYCTFTLVLISFQFYGEIFDLCIMTCKLIFPVSVVFDEVTSFFTMVKHIFLFLMLMFPWQSWFLSYQVLSLFPFSFTTSLNKIWRLEIMSLNWKKFTCASGVSISTVTRLLNLNFFPLMRMDFNRDLSIPWKIEPSEPWILCFMQTPNFLKG